MLSSFINQALIPLLIFISFTRHQTQAEDEHDYSLESSTPLASPEIAEDVMDQNSNWNCARLEAFKDIEKIFNTTDDSAEANVNREEYHSRIKRCTEKKRQDIIIREFERRIQKQEMREGKLKETHHKNNIYKTTTHESATQEYNNQNTNKDSILMDDLYQTMSYSENTEPYSRKYRTLPVNLKPLTNDLSSTSSSQNDKSSSTAPSSFTNTIKKLKESQRNIVSFSQKNSFSREPKVGETVSLSTVPYVIPRIKAKQRKKNNPELRPTKITENDGKRKKGLLRNLLGRVSEVMEGGTLKHSVDLDMSDLNEKSSSTYPDEESIEYETVTSPKFFDHFTKSGDISSSGRSHDQQENSIIQKIREDTKKQLQSKIEELEKLREKMAEIIRQAQLIKNRTKISPPAFDKISAKHETKVIDENVKYNANFNHKLDTISTKSIQKNQIGIQTVKKATNSDMPSKDLQKQHFLEKHTTLSSSAPTQSTERQEKFISRSHTTLKNLPTERIEFHNLHTTVLPSSDIYSSKHHHTNHEQPLKTHLQNENLLKNQNQKDSPLQARSEDNENSNYHPHDTQKGLPTASIKPREQSSKFDSTPSTINIFQTQTKQTQKLLHQLGSSSDEPSITQSLHTKTNPNVLFQPSSTKLPSSSTTLRHGKSSENPAMVEYPHSGKRSTPQISEAKLPTTQPINISAERATSLDHSISDKTTTTHFHNFQQRNAPEESTASLNRHTTKINSPLSLNRDDASSALVGKSHSSVADQLHDIHHPTTIPNSTTQLLLEKITQLTPFYKVEEWKKIITLRKHNLDGTSTHQPIQSHKNISSENISTEKSHISRSTLPLVHHHSHHTDSSKISAYQPPYLPLKVVTPKKFSPLIHSHLNIKNSDDHSSPHPTHPIEENHPVHQLNNHHPSYSTEISSKKNTLVKVQEESSSIPDLVHSPKFKSDENFSPHPHHSIEVTLPMRSHIENYPAHQSNHKIALKKVQEETSSTSHLVHSPKFKSDETFPSHTHHINEVTLPIKFHKENHPVHQTNHPPHSIEIPLKKTALEKIQEETSSTSHLVHSPKFKSDENFTPQPHHFIDVTLPMKSHTENHSIHQTNHHHPYYSNEIPLKEIALEKGRNTENHPVHQPSHRHPSHSTEIPFKKITLEKIQEESNSISHLIHSPKFESDENFSSQLHHYNEVTPPMKSHKENHPVHQPSHHHPSQSTEIPLKKITLEKIQEESNSISHLVHSPKFESDEKFSPHLHSNEATPPMKSYKENHPVHQHNNHHLFLSTEMPLKRSTIEKAQEENSIHSQKFKYSDENFTPHPHHSTEMTLPMKSLAENHPVHQSNHDSFHSIRTHPKKITLEEAQGESSSTSHSVHSSKFNPDENFTPHTTHSIGVTLPVKSSIENHPLHRLHPHHHELQKFDKLSTLEPTHSSESFLKKITSLEKAQDESSSSSHSVHSHSKSKHVHDFLTPKKALPVKVHMKGFTSPMKSYSENKAISQTVHQHQELPHFEKTSTFLPSHSTKINTREIYLPRDSQEIAHVTPLSHSSTTQLKKIDTPPSNILEEIKRLEKEKLEEIRNLQKKQFELLHKSHSPRPSHSTSSNFEVFSEQKNSKHPLIDSTPSHKETHSTKNTAQGRSASEQNINSLHTHDITKPYPTHFTTPTILPNDEMVDMPLPPLNPNDNWKYLKKLDEWYEKQKAKSSTIKPPTIRPPSATPVPRPWTTPSSTVAPMTVPPRLRPVTPSRNRTAPNQRPNSPVTPTTTQKSPAPVNYHIDSTINRSYNITINLVTPDSTRREDEERNEGEVVDNPSSDPINGAGFGNYFDPSINMVSSTGPSKITKNEPTGDFDSSPHPSLPRELPSQSTHLSDFPSVDETTPLPQSFTTTQMKNSPNDDSPFTSAHSENNTILKSSIRSDSKRPKHLLTTTTLHKKILDKLKNPPSKVQTDSTTPASTTLTTDGKTDLHALSHPLSFAGNCTPACNNYIIIIPNKTEEIIQILHKNDQTPLTDQSAILQTSRSAQNHHTSDPNSSSDIKSLLEPIIKAKMTPSNNTELRKSINELMMSLKQRRFNEYAKLYQHKLNPMVGEGRDSIVAISQINEYIELLELMLVYLARDPDKLLDEKKDARVDNFESPYAKDDPQRRLIEGQFHYVHPKILNEFIDVYKKYGNGEKYYGRPAWQFSQENEPRGRSRPRTSGGLLSNLFNFKGLVQPLIYSYNRASMNRPDTQYHDY